MTPTSGLLANYFETLTDLAGRVEATRDDKSTLSLSSAVDWAVERATTLGDGKKIIFIGNGGSAAIASHMAIDFSENGGFPALAFNDGASLTCLSNDLGYEHVFEHHIRALGQDGDILVAISSSGKSDSILNAVHAAREKSIAVLTLSGFDAGNPLRSLGNTNLYVPNDEYGFVEITHLTLCHSILDLAVGWQPESKK